MYTPLRFLCIATLVLLSTIGLVSIHAAQQTPAVQGDFLGTLGPLDIKLHITVAADGKLSGTLDSPNQGAIGIPCTDFRVEGQTLTFSVPAVGGTWKGTIENNGAKLSGTWNQGAPAPLTFTRDTFVAASKPSPVDGYWLGTLGGSLRIQLTVKSDQSGQQCGEARLRERQHESGPEQSKDQRADQHAPGLLCEQQQRRNDDHHDRDEAAVDVRVEEQ